MDSITHKAYREFISQINNAIYITKRKHSLAKKQARINLDGIYRGPEYFPGCHFLRHDEKLCKYWAKLAAAIREWDDSYALHVYISNVELPKKVLTMIFAELKTKNVETIWFNHNDFGRDGVMLLADLMGHVKTLKNVHLGRNRMDCMDSVIYFSEQMKKHPSIEEVRLENCGLGDNFQCLSLILNALRDKRISISLNNNQMLAQGALLLSSFLAANPSTRELSLRTNGFREEDAALFANSLQTNTNLIGLDLRFNKTTRTSNELFHKAIYDNTSLNSVADSNHTCKVNLIWSARGLFVNGPYPNLNRKKKIIKALDQSITEKSDLGCLGNISLELVPEVLGMLQDDVDSRKRMTNTFEFMRRYSMPSLYCFASSNSKN